MAELPRQPEDTEQRVRRRRPTIAEPPAGEVVVTDLRQSGWSWGWDTLAREFAGVLHQSGVGLYFTYATYTDNRKESPYRGSSYTGVEALADFSGESADDIRTVNKILAARGLARFETYTVHIPSKDGRRATRNRLHCYLLERDPHLTTDDVVAVLRLALQDQKVYRYIRHIFRPGFRPIDRVTDAAGAPRDHPNPWYAILPAARRTAEWRALALRAERDLLALRERNIHGVEAAARRRQPQRSDLSISLPDTEAASASSLPDTEDETRVAGTEDDPLATLPATEDASRGILPGTGGKHDQDPSKQTQKPPITTKSTTTTTRAGMLSQPAIARDDPVSTNVPSTEAVVALFGEANGRDVTPVERDLLRRIITDFDGPARQHRPDHSGAVWVTAAIVEAVDAGSRFVSPKRIRLICHRWLKDGFRAPRARAPGSNDAGAGRSLLEVPDLPMPNGQGSRTVWRRVIGIARGSLSADTLIDCLEPCFIASYDEWRREITIAVPDERTGEKLHRSYRHTLERAFATIFGKTMRFRCVVAGAEDESSGELACEDEAVDEEAAADDAVLAPVDRTGPTDVGDGDRASADRVDDAAVDEAAGRTGRGQTSSPAAENAPAAREVANAAGETESLASITPDAAVAGRGHDEASRQLWAEVLDHCGANVSALRRHLFETQAELTRPEGRTLVVVAANGFIADQVERCAPWLEAALRSLLGEDDLRLRCTIRRAECEDR